MVTLEAGRTSVALYSFLSRLGCRGSNNNSNGNNTYNGGGNNNNDGNSSNNISSDNINISNNDDNNSSNSNNELSTPIENVFLLSDGTLLWQTGSEVQKTL